MIRNRHNQVPHLTQDTTWESNKSQLNITNKSQEVSPFPAGDHKAAMNRRESITVSRLSYAPLFEGPHFLTKMLESNILYDNLFIDI